MLLGLRAKAQRVDLVDDLAQVVASRDLVFDLRKNLPDLVLDGVRPGRLRGESIQIRKQPVVHKVDQVVTGHRRVVVELAVRALRRGPAFPAIRRIENVRVGLPRKRRFIGTVLLQPIEILQEQQPRSLLGVVQLGRAASLFPEHIIDVLKRLLKHAPLSQIPVAVGRPIFENPNPAQRQQARSRELKTEASPRIRPLRDGRTTSSSLPEAGQVYRFYWHQQR